MREEKAQWMQVRGQGTKDKATREREKGCGRETSEHRWATLWRVIRILHFILGPGRQHPLKHIKHGTKRTSFAFYTDCLSSCISVRDGWVGMVGQAANLGPIPKTTLY